MRFCEIFVILVLTVGINCQESSKCKPEAAFCPENNEQGISYIRFVKNSQNKLTISLFIIICFIFTVAKKFSVTGESFNNYHKNVTLKEQWTTSANVHVR